MISGNGRYPANATELALALNVFVNYQGDKITAHLFNVWVALIVRVMSAQVETEK